MAKTFQERAKELRSNGLTIPDIVKKLKEEGFKTSRGTPPSKATIANSFRGLRAAKRGKKPELLQLPVAPTSRTVALLLVPADKLQEVLEEVYK